MAWAPDYCTTEELKSHLRITDAADDTLLAVAITAASRAIDQSCNRQFGLTDPAAARYYSYNGYQIDGHDCLEINDVMTITDLVLKVDRDDDGTFEETLTVNTDFRLYPLNAAADGRPWTHLLTDKDTSLPTGLRSVEIVAKWGWSAVPPLVKEAALVQAARFFQRRNAPFGVAGSPDLGSELRLLARVDPDVAVMLASVTRHWVAV